MTAGRQGPPYRVVQWATGGVGRAAIEGVLDHPELELAGCWVHSAEKAGRDVGELVGRAPVGVTATAEVDAVLALDADCVVYSPLFAGWTSPSTTPAARCRGRPWRPASGSSRPPSTSTSRRRSC